MKAETWNALIAAACLSLVACASKPPKLYLIEGPQPPVVKTADFQYRIGLAEVVLPAYASDRRIARRGEDGRLMLDDDHRWAERPEASITRILSARLEEELGAIAIVEPYPRGFDLNVRVATTVDQFLMTEDDLAVMSGILTYSSGDGRNALHIERFSFAAPVSDAGVDAYASAIVVNLQRLGAMSAQTIKGLQSER